MEEPKQYQDIPGGKEPANGSQASPSQEILNAIGSQAIIHDKEATHKVRQSRLSLVYGYSVVALGAVSVFGEQSPANENLRIERGFDTLVRTGNPHAVEKTVALVTVPIETIPAVIIGLAVHSSNPIIRKGRVSLHRWQETGEKREEYRDQVKAEDKNAREVSANDRRVSKGKKPKRTTLEKLSDKEEDARVKNYWRELNGKEPKGNAADSLPKKIVGGVKNELTDLFLALGLGAGIVIFKEAMTNKKVSVKKTIWTGAKAIAEISFVSGKIGYFVAAGTNKAQWDVPLMSYTLHYEKQAQWLIDYGTDTKALMTVLLLAYAPGTIYKLIHRMPKKEQKFQSWLAEKKGREDHIVAS